MRRVTRRSVLAAVGVGLASAGCLSQRGERNGDETTTGGTTETTRETTDAATDETTAEDATTGDWIARASNSPDPDHEITLRSEAAESRTLRVAVVREATGETVFETTADASASERTLYNLREADPEGVESFRVCAELVGAGGTDDEATATDSPHRDCVSIDTNECYGNAHVTLREDKSVQIVYAIC